MNCTSIVGNWYVSKTAMILATVLTTISLLFSVAGTDAEICKSFILKKNITWQFDSRTDSWALWAIVKNASYILEPLDKNY